MLGAARGHPPDGGRADDSGSEGGWVLEPVGEMLGTLRRLTWASGTNRLMDRDELGLDEPAQSFAACADEGVEACHGRIEALHRGHEWAAPGPLALQVDDRSHVTNLSEGV